MTLQQQPILLSPIDRIASAFARVASAAQQLKVAAVVRAAVDHCSDVVDFELRRLVAAARALSILAFEQSGDVVDMGLWACRQFPRSPIEFRRAARSLGSLRVPFGPFSKDDFGLSRIRSPKFPSLCAGLFAVLLIPLGICLLYLGLVARAPAFADGSMLFGISFTPARAGLTLLLVALLAVTIFAGALDLFVSLWIVGSPTRHAGRLASKAMTGNAPLGNMAVAAGDACKVPTQTRCDSSCFGYDHWLSGFHPLSKGEY